MKKVLVGICPIGNGHINRQICVIRELLSNNFEILIATDDSKIQMLKNIFPNEKYIAINIPWIVCDDNGFNFADTLNRYNNNDLFKKFLEFGIDVEKKLNGKPDLVITDYEPNVAQYSYAQSIPLITMEQQSKYMYIDEIEMHNYSIKEEIYRLNYFFPKFNKKIISSFFPLDIKEENVIQVSPIIPKLNRYERHDSFILVYFSPYSNSDKYEKIINILKEFKNISFKVFSNNYDDYVNKYNDDFKEDLAKCSALITTGGHQLISEAISLEVPLYVLPLETYEQHYNAYMVEHYGLGTNEKISEESIRKFIENRNNYVNNIKKYKKKYYKEPWQKILVKTIESINK